MHITRAVLLAWVALGCSRTSQSPAEQIERTRERADQLHAKAIHLQGEPGRAEQAARLHRMSARLRPPSDPRAFDCYAQASQVLVAAGRLPQARALMEESADFALGRGDSVNAARSLAEAERLASKEGLPRLVLALDARLRTIAGGHALSPQEHAQLEAETAPVVAQAVAAIRSAPRAPAR